MITPNVMTTNDHAAIVSEPGIYSADGSDHHHWRANFGFHLDEHKQINTLI